MSRFSMEPPEEPMTCECKPCRRCEGEGELEIRWTQNLRGEDVQLQEPVMETCSTCRGTGKDMDDCSIHCDVEDLGACFERNIARVITGAA